MAAVRRGLRPTAWVWLLDFIEDWYNHSAKKSEKRHGAVGKTAVTGMKDRETNRVTAASIEGVEERPVFQTGSGVFQGRRTGRKGELP